MTVQFVSLEERHIPDALVLARESFLREQMHVPSLPVEAAGDMLRDAVANAVRNGIGVAAEEAGRLQGFMSFYGPIDNLFGNAPGAISPIHAHAATGERRDRLFSWLFQHAAEAVVGQGMTSLTLSTFAHDRDLARALSFNGFGIRNADAIRDLQAPIDTSPVSGYTFAALAPEETLAILPLENALIQHLRSSPTLLALDDMTEEAFIERAREARFFVARTGSGIVGYIKITQTGENLLTTVPAMQNITGAYLLPEHRGRGVYRGLAAYAAATLRDKGVRLLGVDFETMNPAAFHFWSKYFDIYTHSYARRIDERVLDRTPS
jgi:GNAT superfamily N-acetyltransferase